MPQSVLIEKLGREVEFPDDMTPEEITTAIERDILPNIPTAADVKTATKPPSIAEQARTRLRSRGTSPEEVKSAAAAAPDTATIRAQVTREARAGGTPVDDATIDQMVQERSRKYRGGKQLFRDPTVAEANKAAMIGAGVGFTEGVAQGVTTAIDLAGHGTDPATVARTASAIGQGYAQDGISGALSAGMEEVLPLTSAVGRLASKAQEKLKHAAGIGDDVILDVPDAATRLAGNLAAPGPEVLAGSRLTRARAALRAGKVEKAAESGASLADLTLQAEAPPVHEYPAGEAPAEATPAAAAPAESAPAKALPVESGYDVSLPPDEAPGAAKTSAPPVVSAKAPDAPKSIKEIKDTLTTKFREFVDDDWYRVRKLTEDPNVSIRDASDPYTAEILTHGRLDTRVKQLDSTFEKIDRDIVDTSKRLGINNADLQRDVNEYMHSRHAPDFNAQHGDGAAGITDVQAEQNLQRIAATPHAEDVMRIAQDFQYLNRETLDIALDGELITKELHDKLQSQYENHVPLNRIMDDTDDVADIIGTRPLDVRSSGIRRAKGSQREVADIGTNIVANYKQVLVRAEKNRVNLATLHFARENPDLGLFTESRPQAIGRKFKKLEDEGPAAMIMDRTPENDPQTLTAFDKGKKVYLHIGDRSLATALKGMNRLKVDGWFRYVGAYTRFMAGLATRWNPEFLLPNKLRDLQEAAVYAFSKGDFSGKQVAKIAAGDLRSVKDVFDGVRGADTAGARLYDQMRRDGGTTGGMGLSTRKQVELDVEAIRKTNRSAPRLAVQKTLRWIDGMNTVIEDSTKLSIYRFALENGISRTRAARMAKEGAINFNKFGRGGPQLNAMYMFANASVQGSVKMLRAMKNPKVAAAVTSSIAAAVFSTARWNDHIDPTWRDEGHVTDYDKASSLIVMLPPSADGSSNYLKVPVSWGVKPIKVAMDFAESSMSGHGKSPGETVQGIIGATIEGYNPVGGTDWVSAIVPTAADLPVDIARNRAWHGGPLRPDRPATPPSQNFFRSLPKTNTGAAAIGVSQALSSRGIEVSPADLKYAYESLVGGAGRAANRVISTVASIGRGELPDINEVPVVNRFVESIPPDRLEAARRALAKRKAEKATIDAKIRAARERRE